MTEIKKYQEDLQKSDNHYQRTERILYQYKINIAKLAALEDELKILEVSTDVKCQDYSREITEHSSPSNPVEARVIRIEKVTEMIMRVKLLINPVNRLEKDLSSSDVLEGSINAEMLKILRLCYFGGNSADQVAEELHITRRTVYNIRHKLVRLAMEYII